MSHPSRRNRTYARTMRKDMTPAEVALWQQLRRNALGVRFRRQHPIGPYIVDFVCIERMLVVEVDGSYHDWAERRDEPRSRFLEFEGFRVLRFENDDVTDYRHWVVEEIGRALAEETT